MDTTILGLQGKTYWNGYRSWETVYSRFTKWQDEGVFEKIFECVSSDVDSENLMIDWAFIKVSQGANGGVKKGGPKSVGRTKGGVDTKIYVAVDALGDPVNLFCPKDRGTIEIFNFLIKGAKDI